ncbi:VOC family protein [Pararhizobium haloflavum]|uniref:VOC family protein n=1 Tax=Pararhizobium haloflavum TaxID=2037914 RepID=UPI000C18A176|nr:VOC family protein [Pararhizobium haloflavum]
MPSTMNPFLMFQGDAQAAIDHYLAVFPEGRIAEISHYGPGEGAGEGKVVKARIILNGLEVMVIDSPPVHDFTFTPATSLFVHFDQEAELDRAFSMLGEGGLVLMPLDTYPFARKYAWLNDRFGVSWQLSLS